MIRLQRAVFTVSPVKKDAVFGVHSEENDQKYFDSFIYYC